jgi:alpha-glucosidase
MKKSAFALLCIVLSLKSFSQAVHPDRCVSFDKQGNQVIFNFENKSKLLIKLCSRSVIKIWYEPTGSFSRSNESFAVVNEDLETINDVHIESQDQAYEIFTDFLRIRLNKHPFSLQIFDKYQKLLLGDYKDLGHHAELAKVSSHKILRQDEQFFGLGEKTGSLNRRGKTFKMWNSDKPCYSTSEDPLYKSIPFFMSSYRYGIFFDNTFKSEFDFGFASAESFSFSSPGGELLYYFIQGNDYKEIIGSYTQLTGQPIMPPKWAFGFSQSRGLLTKESLSRDIAKGYRDRNIPCDIIYQDIGWTQYLQDFEWRKGNYNNPKQMLSDLSKDGFKVIVSQDPVVSQANQQQWRQADSLQYFALDARTGKSYDMPWPWGGNCGVVDFTKPQVAEWWGALQQKPVDDGIKGFWTDMGEPAWTNEESTDRLQMQHHAGSHDEIHNVYGFNWDKVVTEQFEKRNPNVRIFQMTRAGYAGLQRYTFGWSGDAGSGSNVLDGWGRLANQVQVAQSAGMGLIPFWSCDISGYCGDIKDYDELAELYVRWLQFGVFNPISRAHHEGNNAVEPWLFGAEAERIARQSIELKYQLFPYLYTYGREAYDTGLPIMRAMILEYPDDPEAIKAESQFMIGEELLVAPVVEKNAEVKRLYLPQGDWIVFEAGTKYKGGQWIDFPVNLETIPLFVRSGSIIPMMPVMQYIHQQKNYPIILKVFPKNSGKISFELYEDDGISNDYKKDVASKRNITCESSKGQITLTVDSDKQSSYKPEQRNFLVEIPLSEKPSAVLINGQKTKTSRSEKLLESLSEQFISSLVSYDKEKHMVLIRMPDTLTRVTVEIKH